MFDYGHLNLICVFACFCIMFLCHSFMVCILFYFIFIV